MGGRLGHASGRYVESRGTYLEAEHEPQHEAPLGER